MVSAFVDTSIVMAQGLWMVCMALSSGHMQCEVYNSILSLLEKLQAATTQMVLVALLGLVVLMVTVVSTQCTNCMHGDKVKVWIAAVFVFCNLLVLIPPSWFINISSSNFYN
uniref:Uncharacterized protein n=1 Tax=Sphaerodactylus townsendi TaxID=933632 RepID=A0ACB8FIZ6_9SAUR